MQLQDPTPVVNGVPPSKAERGTAGKDNTELTVLGACTGTGLGHLECALVRFGQKSPTAPLRVKLVKFDSIPVPAAVRDSILSYPRTGHRDSKSKPRLDELLGRLFSGGIHTFCSNHGLKTSSIDLVGTHSEALRLASAQYNLDGAREHPSNWNSIIAAETGISTVFDFAIVERAVIRHHVRPTAYFNRVLLRHPSIFRVCLSIDEIANLSFIPANGDDGARATFSRDVGPGSLLIDYAMRYCTSNDRSEDHDGQVGSQGKVNQTIVDRFLDAHDYVRQPPSPSIATEMFGDHEAQQLVDECLYSGMSEADTIATVTRVTAQNIFRQYTRLLNRFPPSERGVEELFICGPAARNSNVIGYLESVLPESVITKPLHEIGIPDDAHEAVCYAYLTLEAVLGQASQFADAQPAPSTTTPETDTVRARFVPGSRWNELLSNVLEFGGGQRNRVATDVRIIGSLEAGMQNMDLE